MKIPVLVNGVAGTLENPTVSAFMADAGGFLAVWHTDPLVQLERSDGQGESQSYVISTGDKTNPIIQAVGEPLQINGAIWVTRERDWNQYVNLYGRGGWPGIGVCQFLRIGADGSVSLLAGVESDGQFWRGFAKGAVTWAVITYGAVTLAGMVGSGALGVSPTAAAVAPSDWAIATAGMGEGMGTGGLIANAAGAMPVVQAVAPVAQTVPTLAQIGGAVQTAVQTVQQAASSIVGVAAAVETVKAAVHTPDAPIPRPADPSLNISPVLIGAGILLLVLVTVE